MKKFLAIFSFFALMFIMFLSGCSASSNYMEISGYKNYISDTNAGYYDIVHYNVVDSMENNSNAREYFIKNNRRKGDYLITDYEDGVCINKFYGSPDSNGIINIPETIDNKSVVKLGGYIESIDDENVIGAFGGYADIIIKIPSTVKVISQNATMNNSGIIPEESRYMFVDIFGFEVDKNNPYYSSKNGTLYSKDYTKLLWVNTMGRDNNNPDWFIDEYIVPEYVETFEPSNGIYCLLNKIKIGKNVKKINTYIDKGESGIEPDPDLVPDVIICGYNDSIAEKWAKEQYAKFEELKDWS